MLPTGERLVSADAGVTPVASVIQVRADLPHDMHAAGEIDISEIKVIHLQDNDPDYPFAHSTQTAAPEWPLAAMPHVSQVRACTHQRCQHPLQRHSAGDRI